MPNLLRKIKYTNASQKQEEITKLFWDNLINKRNPLAWQALCSPDITFVGSLSTRVWKGYDGIIEYAPLMFSRFDDFSIAVNDTITEGNRTVAMLNFSGLNTAGLFGNPPCGKRVNYDAVGILTFRDDKIVDVKVTGAVIQIMEQMGQVV